MNKQADAAHAAFTTIIKRLIERKVLSRSIDVLHKPAVGHERHGVPRGEEVYRILYGRAASYAHAYAEKWGFDLCELYAILPALEHLRHLACAPKLNE
jgi:hypothetical protein